jgi:hypothetical protein
VRGLLRDAAWIFSIWVASAPWILIIDYKIAEVLAS